MTGTLVLCLLVMFALDQNELISKPNSEVEECSEVRALAALAEVPNTHLVAHRSSSRLIRCSLLTTTGIACT